MKKKFLIPLIVVAVIFAFGIGYKVKAASVTMKISNFASQLVAMLNTSANLTIINEAGLMADIINAVKGIGGQQIAANPVTPEEVAIEIENRETTQINCSHSAGGVSWTCGTLTAGSEKEACFGYVGFVGNGNTWCESCSEGERCYFHKP